MKTPQSLTLTIPTPTGTFTARYSSKGLGALAFPSGKKRQTTEAKFAPANVRHWHNLTRQALKLALAGRAPKRLPPLDLSAGTVFQQRVWKSLRKIGAGETKCYAELARALGKRSAARAVGGACGANPIPLFVPCHRVLAANGRLGGFSAGLQWKRLLLTREGVRFK